MTFSQADLPHIKWSLLTFILTVALGGSLVLFSQKYAKDAQLAMRSAKQQQNDARDKLSAAHQDKENMSTYMKEFSAIQKRDVIGDEQRLNLIEGLETLRKRSRVLDFKYAISPQQPYKPLVPLVTGNFDLKLSPMTLKMDLLHEGQMINFFDNLRRDMNGWFILEKCTLERSTSAEAQLKADCAGGWLTLKNRIP